MMDKNKLETLLFYLVFMKAVGEVQSIVTN